MLIIVHFGVLNCKQKGLFDLLIDFKLGQCQPGKFLVKTHDMRLDLILSLNIPRLLTVDPNSVGGAKECEIGIGEYLM